MRDQNAKEQALAAHRRGSFAEAEQLYKELIRSFPSDAEVHYLMGLLCHQTGRDAESIQSLKTALELAPASLKTLQLLVPLYDRAGDAESALVALDRYLEQCPEDAGVLNIKGQHLIGAGRLRDAEQVLRRAANISGSAAMFHDLGLGCQLLGDPSGAALAYEEAIRRGHNHPKTQLWLAQCLRATGRTKEYYETVTCPASSAAGDIELLIEAQSARRYVCDWDGFEDNRPALQTALTQVLETDAEQVIPPGILNYLDVDERTISAIARRYAGQLSAIARPFRHESARKRAHGSNGRIRLGYLSTDFFSHAVGSLVRDLFHSHDHDRFEIHGYSLRHQPDAVQSCIQQGCDIYRNLSGASPENISQRIYDDQVEILIDLAGYTSAAQPTVLAARPAPVQISWLGYLGTSGSDFMDYIIADDMTLPPELAANYTERIIRLPRFLVASPLPMAEHCPSREDVGLARDGFVFCSFNQPYKLDPQAFSAWMDILRRVPGSQLWMYAPDTEICRANLLRKAAQLGIEPGRLVFAPREPMAEHVARMGLADLALDPFHISGGATSVASLSAGVPVLTLRGNSFLARMGSSINASLGMDCLDCSLPDQYVEKAVELAMDAPMLAAVKHRLDIAINTSYFFDSGCFVRTLEEALGRAWEGYTGGMPPADINVLEYHQVYGQ
jgi:predicted O-linked N-acetylglucosamine transferase (SPINDLY family)